MTHNEKMIALTEAATLADNAKIAELQQAGFKRAGLNRLHRGDVSISFHFAAYSYYAKVKVNGQKVHEGYLADLDLDQF